MRFYNEQTTFDLHLPWLLQDENKFRNRNKPYCLYVKCQDTAKNNNLKKGYKLQTSLI